MEQNTSAPTVTQEVIKAKLNIALTTNSFFIQKIQDEADKLQITEDNLQGIADFIAKTKKAEKIVEEKHKEVKAPYLEAGRMCDAAKNDLIAIFSAIRTPIALKYNRLCIDIEAKRRDQEQAEAKRKQISQGIENNVITFSNRIAACTTSEELLAIERLINLEKSPSYKAKYGDLHDEAIARYDTILKTTIADQKEKIKESIKLLKQREAAQVNNDIDLLDTIDQKHEELQEKIQHNRVDVQEKALNQTPISTYQRANTVFPTVKPSRVGYDMELVDVHTAIKKAKGLLNIELNKEAAKSVLETLKSTGQFDDKDEIIVNGIKYFKKIKYA